MMRRRSCLAPISLNSRHSRTSFQSYFAVGKVRERQNQAVRKGGGEVHIETHPQLGRVAIGAFESLVVVLRQ